MPPINRLVVLWTIIVCVLLGNNLLMWGVEEINLSDPSTLALSFFGYLTAQIGLLAAWCVLANQPAIVRMPLTSLLVLVGCSLVLIGFRDKGAGNIWVVLLIFHAGALALFALAQLPLWIVRFAAGRRIASVAETTSEPALGNVPMRYLFIVTAMVSVLLAVSRLWCGGSDGGWILGDRYDSQSRPGIMRSGSYTSHWRRSIVGRMDCRTHVGGLGQD